MSWVQKPWVVAGGILTVVLIICLLSRLATGVRNPVSHEILKQTDVILKAANKWATMATQDTNVVMALMHICYAKAYVGTLRRILKDDQMQKAHHVDMRDLEQKMDDTEQAVLAKLSQAAPQIMPEGEFAVRTGWLG